MSAVALWYVAGAIVMYATGFAAGATHRNIARMLSESAR